MARLRQRRDAPAGERSGRCQAVADRAHRRVARALLAAAEEVLGLALFVLRIPPQRTLVRLWLVGTTLLHGQFSLFAHFGVRASGRARWLPSPDGVVFMLIGANVAVYMLWQLVDPSFMEKHFTVSDQSKGLGFYVTSGRWKSDLTIFVVSRFLWTISRAGGCTHCSRVPSATRRQVTSSAI